MKYIFILFTVTSLLVNSCSSLETKNTTTAALTGSYTVHFMEDIVINKVKPTIVFDKEKKTISGYAGCNSYTATYDITATEIFFSNVALTRADCIQGMEEEIKFVEALKDANRYTAQKDLIILFKDDKVLVKAQNSMM